MVGGEVVLRLLPQTVVVFALDHVSAHAHDLLHDCIVKPTILPLRAPKARGNLSEVFGQSPAGRIAWP